MLRRDDIPILLLGLLLAGVLFVLRSAGQTPDGLSYAIAVRDGVDVCHPHHLLHGPVTRLIHLATGRGDPLVAGVLHNLVFLVVLGVAAKRLAQGLGAGAAGATLAAAVLLATRGVVFYATHVETYLPALAALTGFAAAWRERAERPGPAAAWLVLAVLYHQTNVLAVVPALAASSRRRADLRAVLVPAGLVVWATYVAVWGFTGVREGLFAWLTGYVRADVPAWGSFGHFGPAGLRDLGLNQLRMVLPVPASLAGPAALAFFAGLALLAAVNLRAPTRRADRRFHLVFLAVYLLFFLWWIPADPDFFLATLLPLGALGLLAVGDLPPWGRGRWWAIPAGVLLAGNLAFVAVPMHRDPGPTRAVARALAAAAPADAVLVVGYGVQQELLYAGRRTPVYEGDELGWNLAQGRIEPPAPPVAIGADYAGLLLSRASDTDAHLLRTLTGFAPGDGNERATWRRPQTLPGNVGLLFGAARDSVADWPAAVSAIRAAVRGTP